MVSSSGSRFFDRSFLSIAGDAIAYATFERDLRAEYAWVRFESLYRAARARFLRALLAERAAPATRERVDGPEELEAPAPANLARTLLELGSPVGTVHLHATDEHIFVTSAGRLIEIHAWADVYYLTVSRFAGESPACIRVAFDAFDERALGAYVDDPISRDFVSRARALPAYPEDAETSEETDPFLVYARGRGEPLEGPRREPRRRGESVYR